MPGELNVTAWTVREIPGIEISLGLQLALGVRVTQSAVEIDIEHIVAVAQSQILAYIRSMHLVTLAVAVTVDAYVRLLMLVADVCTCAVGKLLVLGQCRVEVETSVCTPVAVYVDRLRDASSCLLDICNLACNTVECIVETCVNRESGLCLGVVCHKERIQTAVE